MSGMVPCAFAPAPICALGSTAFCAWSGCALLEFHQTKPSTSVAPIPPTMSQLFRLIHHNSLALGADDGRETHNMDTRRDRLAFPTPCLLDRDGVNRWDTARHHRREHAEHVIRQKWGRERWGRGRLLERLFLLHRHLRRYESSGWGRHVA